MRTTSRVECELAFCHIMKKLNVNKACFCDAAILRSEVNTETALRNLVALKVFPKPEAPTQTLSYGSITGL